MIARLAPWILLAAALVFPRALPAAEVEVPALKARVTDLTGTLAADQRAGLEARIAEFEARKGSQVAVLIVPTTQPEAVEQFAIRVFDQWKLGRKGVDDGLLILVAKNDRKLRIEVGRGLEGVIPDAVAKRIVSEVIAPRFREGDFYGGIDSGVDRILRAIDGEPLPPPKPRAQQTSQGDDWSTLLVVGLIIALVVGSLLRSIFGRFVGSGMVGAGAGALGYFMVGTIAALVVGVAAFLISLLTGLAPGRGSGWSSGQSWGHGGFGSGGGFGGGGFSGGGGGSAGGGASGSW